MALLPLMVLKEPYRRPGPSARLPVAVAAGFANDWIQIFPREFFNAHRSKHLKLICPSKLDSPCTYCPEEGPGMLHQFF
jgi:hypothetical protein